MAADKTKIAADCWRKATEALSKESWDYAIDMFSKAVALAPDNLAYRQHLRGAQKKKFGDNPKNVGRMTGMKLLKVRGMIKKSRMQKNWAEVDRLAEEGLQVNPWDAGLNADVGEANVNIGYRAVAMFAFENAVANDPRNKGYLTELARLSEEAGNYQNAISLYEKLYKLDPLDPEARSKLTQLQASTVMRKGGYEDAETTREVRTGYDYDRDAAAARKKSAEPEGPGESVEADLQRQIRKEESNPDHYMKLAAYYRREKRYQEAYDQLNQALQLSGGDHNIRELLEDVELENLKHNLDTAKEAFKADPSDETARKNAGALAREYIQREIEVLTSRTERYPKDTRLKYDLAQRYMRLQNWAKAIPLLQQSSADARIEADVLVSLGECFYNDGKKPLALRQFEKALPKISSHDQPDLFKKTHYALGAMSEADGNVAKADEHYNEILAVDYEYRDVLKRLENLQAAE